MPASMAFRPNVNCTVVSGAQYYVPNSPIDNRTVFAGAE
jgi:hypothetical protein